MDDFERGMAMPQAFADGSLYAADARVAGSDAPSISYATVYPLTMLLRVVAAQLLVLIFL